MSCFSTVVRTAAIASGVALAAAPSVAVSPADAATWKARQRITRDYVGFGSSSVAIDSRGRAAVAWSVGKPLAGGAIEDAVRVSVQGVSRRWGKPVTLAKTERAQAGVGTGGLQIAMDQKGTATVVWAWQDGSVYAATHRPGHRWSKPRLLGQNAERFEFAEAPSGAAVIGYSGCLVGRCGLRMRMRPAGRDWTRPSLIAGGTALRLSRVAANNRGDAVATWSTQAPVAGHSAMRPANGRWTAVDTDAIGPEGLTMDQRGVATVLYKWGSDLVAARLKFGPHARWGPPHTLGMHGAGFGVLALDPAGWLTAMWFSPSPDGSQIQSAVRPARAPWSRPAVVAGYEKGSWAGGLLVAGRGKAATLFYQPAPLYEDGGNYVWMERRNKSWAAGPPVPVTVGLALGFIGAGNRRGDIVLLITDASGLASISGRL